MGRIWGTIYRIRVEIVIVSSEYVGVDVIAVIVLCLFIIFCLSSCAVHCIYIIALIRLHY